MNWGHKIVIGFVSFVIFMIAMVSISMSTDFYLVEENYYEEELAYQDKIDSRSNGNQWVKQVSITDSTDYIIIRFEGASLVKEGSIQFFRPSDATLDFTIPLVENFKLPKKEFKKGKWIIKLEWGFDNKKYVKEETLIINS